MMKKRKNGWMRKGIIAMVSALTIAASAGTVLAYEPLQWSDVSVNDSIQDNDIDYLTYNVADAPLVDSFDFSVSDKIFISLDGKQEPIFNVFFYSYKYPISHNTVSKFSTIFRQ